MRNLIAMLVATAACALGAGQAVGGPVDSTAAEANSGATSVAKRQLATKGGLSLRGWLTNRVRRTLDFVEYGWTHVAPNAPWEPRTGLQVVDIDGAFYLMGGRTPIDSPIPGDGIIHGDVWRSTDDGSTWQEIVEDTEAKGDWPARAFFGAVRKGSSMYVLGGQNFRVRPNACPPPPIAPGCPPFVSISDFFADVWASKDGVNWTLKTSDAGWEGRAGLSVVVHNGEIYVLGGSRNDDEAVIGGPPVREYFNDVWKSRDGVRWKRVIEHAPWAPRAGAAAVVKHGYIYLLGGEGGFACEPLPFCTPPYFNDVWRSKDGKRWEQVTPAAGWSPRPGHKCGILARQIVCFGGFGLLVNPADIWVSYNGRVWRQVAPPGALPWNITDPDDARYDFALVSREDTFRRDGAIYTFGGDRERFDLPPNVNVDRVDNDVWRYAPPRP